MVLQGRERLWRRRSIEQPEKRFELWFTGFCDHLSMPVLTMCFSMGSRRRSAPQVSDLIDTEGVTRARLFTPLPETWPWIGTLYGGSVKTKSASAPSKRAPKTDWSRALPQERRWSPSPP